MTLNQAFRRFEISEKSSEETKALNSMLIAGQTAVFEKKGFEVELIPIGMSGADYSKGMAHFAGGFKARQLIGFNNSKKVRVNKKPLKAVNIETGEIVIFDSIGEAEQAGYNRKCINRCATYPDRHPHHMGYSWRYK